MDLTLTIEGEGNVTVRDATRGGTVEAGTESGGEERVTEAEFRAMLADAEPAPDEFGPQGAPPEVGNAVAPPAQFRAQESGTRRPPNPSADFDEFDGKGGR
jgi:hypothetical protein